MLALAGGAWWLGGIVWQGLILAIIAAVMVEWVQLVLAFSPRFSGRLPWVAGGSVYLAVAGYAALDVLAPADGLLWVIAMVVAVDVGAYFAGRGFGGPRIAPAISPSKTWSGLGGAVLGASLVFLIAAWRDYSADLALWHKFVAQHGVPGAWDGPHLRWQSAVLFGVVTAIVAQTGDFFESWMKRRAGVKDSGRLIPGHGGVFDRTDGLIAVLFVIGAIALVSAAMRP